MKKTQLKGILTTVLLIVALTTQTVRVYSNADQVELWLNGASLGAKTGTNGTFVWEGVEMRRGANRLQARTNAGADEATVYIR